MPESAKDSQTRGELDGGTGSAALDGGEQAVKGGFADKK
jgi:hypothetical protein